MADDVVNLSIGKEIVGPIVEKKIQAAITEHLGDFDKILQGIIANVLNQKVDSQGKISWSSYDKMTWLEYVCNDLIRKSVQKGVENVLATKTKDIEKACEKAILSRKGDLARAFATAMAQGVKDSWHLHVTVKNGGKSTDEDY
jgi:hypothetical protein